MQLKRRIVALKLIYDRKEYYFSDVQMWTGWRIGRCWRTYCSSTVNWGRGDGIQLKGMMSRVPGGTPLRSTRLIIKPYPAVWPQNQNRAQRDSWIVDARNKAIRTYGPIYSSSIYPSQQDYLLYIQFFRTHPSSISSSIHSIHCGTHLSLYLNISMCDLILKDLLRQI
jgi:hypothetical protein